MSGGPTDNEDPALGQELPHVAHGPDGRTTSGHVTPQDPTKTHPSTSVPLTAAAFAPDELVTKPSAAEVPGSQPQSPEPPKPQTAFRHGGQSLQTANDVAAWLGVQSHQLIWTLYRAPEEARYRAFEIPKRTGGMRPIHAPLSPLRDWQHQIAADLTELYRAHPNAHGFLHARSIGTNAMAHINRRWVLNVDLADFFPSINFGRVRGLLMRPPFDMAPAAATVVAQIVTHQNGLPQGAPTSPVLSNLIAATLDRRLLRLARQHRLIYSRYADDITLSTNQPVFPPDVAAPIGRGAPVAVNDSAASRATIEAGPALEQAVSGSGFRINPKKLRLQRHGERQEVTGLTVNRRLNVNRRRVRQLRAMLHAWRKYGLPAAGHEHFAKYRGGYGKTGPTDKARAFRNIVYGHLSFLKMVRGADDQVFLKLAAQVLELDPNPSKFLRQMIFGADDYDLFISHASEDKETVARPIFHACQRAGLKAFLDDPHIGWGESFTSKINVALGASRTVIVVLSSHSVTKSWPLKEINTALGFEVDGEKRVIAVMVGRPDLSALPLLRGKRWIDWSGDADAVVATILGEIDPRSSKQGRNAPGEATDQTPEPRDWRSDRATAQTAKTPRKRGLWSRLLGR